MYNYLLGMLIVGILTLLYALYQYMEIMKLSPGTKKMQEVSAEIKKGAIAFLEREYKVIATFVLIITFIIIFSLDDKTTALHEGLATAIAFISGSLCSVIAGVIGMRSAVNSNARTANAALKNLHYALDIAFSSGIITGLCVVSLGIIGLSFLMLLYSLIFGFDLYFVIKVIAGFGFGASLIALFARVGGGIYTKAADVGADLVGKVEKGIPEDDPRNPAVIADNVGDNVGDVAGMGADLFESYIGSIIAAMTLGLVSFNIYGINGILLPMVLSTTGIIASLIGAFYVKMSKLNESPERILKNGLIVSTFVMMILSYVVIRFMININPVNLYIAVLVGLIVGTSIGIITEYFTSSNFSPTRKLAEASKTGAGTTIITGLSLGYLSTLLPVFLICIGIYFSYLYGGLYGVALAGVGMLSILGYSLSTDAYAPVADNAGGIAEMAKMPKKVRKITDELDSAGNTTAAIGKGFAIGSAALTTLALFSAYMVSANLKIINIANPKVIIGLFIGALLPMIFSAVTMQAVGKTASAIVNEVRRQFSKNKGLMSGKTKADTSKCIDIATKASLKEMILPGMIAVIFPLMVGLMLGSEALGAMLAGSLVIGVLLAVSMANSGGAWDNAKKYIEKGNFGGKGSEAHKASVVGDTVGDPFKDTAGPSLNILIKLMTIVALVFVSFFI